MPRPGEQLSSTPESWAQRVGRRHERGRVRVIAALVILAGSLGVLVPLASECVREFQDSQATSIPPNEPSPPTNRRGYTINLGDLFK